MNGVTDDAGETVSVADYQAILTYATTQDPALREKLDRKRSGRDNWMALFVSFAVRDDLGRPEPGCEAGDDTTDAASDDAGSVGVDGQLQDGLGDGDTAGGL